MTETLANFPNPDMPTIIPDTCVKRPKTDADMTYLNNNNIDEAICQKISKKDLYETDMHKIYNIIVGQTNEQMHQKAASDATFQAVKTSQYLIVYLMILNKLCLLKQSNQHPIRSLCLATRRLYNTIHHTN